LKRVDPGLELLACKAHNYLDQVEMELKLAMAPVAR
jgi:hypothetical protein